MPSWELKPAHKAVATYYVSLAKFQNLSIKHERGVRSAFEELVDHCGRQFHWKLVPEDGIKRKDPADASARGPSRDHYGLIHGYWEAKDGADDLDKEIKSKFAAGCQRDNILLQKPRRRRSAFFFIALTASCFTKGRVKP